MSVAIEEMKEAVERLFEVVQEIADIEAEAEERIKPLKENKKRLERWILVALEEQELKAFNAGRVGVSISERSSYTIPQTEEDRQSFFEYLKERGVFDELITVHSATLNKFLNAEEELAMDRGEFDFRVPGIAPATTVKTVKVKANKK